MDFTLAESATEFGDRFRDWLEVTLPQEWRDILPGSIDDAELVEIRRQWTGILYDAGWVGPTWPKEYGGLALNVEEQLAYLTESVRVGAPDHLNANPVGILGPCLMRYGTADQRARYLDDMLSGRAQWCQGFSEPGAGSDVANIQTRATAVPGGFMARGQKVWTTNGHGADFAYLLARSEPESTRQQGLSMFILDMRQPGVDVRPLRNIAGTYEFNEVFLDDAFIPEENLIGERGAGWAIAMFALSQERTMAVAHRALRMRGDFERASEIVASLDSPPSWARTELAELAISTRIVEAVIWRNIAVDAQGNDLGAMSPMALLTWSRASQRMREFVVRLLGDGGLHTEGAHAEWVRALLFSRGATLAGGTSEIQLNNIAKSLGLPSTRGR